MAECIKVHATFCLLCILLSVNSTSTTIFIGCTRNSPLCLSQPVSYMCSGENGTGLSDDLLRWRIRNSTNAPDGGTAYAEGTDVPTPRIIGTYFETILTSSADPMRSNISFSPVLAISNYTILCDIIGTTPVGCSIIIADVLAAPVSDIKFTSDTLIFSWTPQSTSPCLSHYSVNVTSIEYTINTTDTSLSLPVPSTNDTEYSISVVAVDTAGRYMDPTNKITFIVDVPESVTDLMLHQTGLSIYVSWNEPATPMLLPLLNYIIYLNVTDHYTTSITIPAPSTTYNISDATVGSRYTVGVAAVNVLGTGNIESALLSVYNYTLIHTTLTHSTISVTIRGTPQSISSSLNISSTKTTLSTHTCTCTCTPCAEQSSSNTVSVLAISFPITFILSMIITSILSSVITCCCVSSRSVQSYSVTNQSTTAADYEIPIKSASLEMNDNMAYGHVSVGNRSTSGTTSTVYETVDT